METVLKFVSGGLIVGPVFFLIFLLAGVRSKLAHVVLNAVMVLTVIGTIVLYHHSLVYPGIFNTVALLKSTIFISVASLLVAWRTIWLFRSYARYFRRDTTMLLV